MYRSARADRKYFFRQLKIWLICSAALILLGVGALGYLYATAEAEEKPVFALVEMPTYSETLTMAAIKIDDTNILYGVQEIIEEPEVPVYQIPTDVPGVYRTKIIALTFDDGPSWLTSELLDILDEYDARVTFCVVGNLVERNSSIVIRAFEAGHEIVGHSWDHKVLARQSVQNISAQISRTGEAIEKVTGEPSPPFFRVPYGQFNNRIRTAANEHGYAILNWSIDTEDWRYRCEEHIYEHIMENATDGAIILLHDIHPTTILAMETVIPELINQGYELVTASELVYHIYGGWESGIEFTGLRR